MNITLCSAFRNSVANGHLPRYLDQCDALMGHLHSTGHKLSFVWGEGDSIDDTPMELMGKAKRFGATLVDCTHGGRDYGSVERPERFRQLAYVGRQIFGAIPPGADVVIYVESDLIWQPATMLGLIERLSNTEGAAAVAPPILLQRRGWPRGTWYDTYAFVADGVHFAHRPPWHGRLLDDGLSAIQLDTAGSCLAMRADWARLAGAQMGERVLMWMCEQFREWGGSVWLDLTVPAVIHE